MPSCILKLPSKVLPSHAATRSVRYLRTRTTVSVLHDQPTSDRGATPSFDRDVSLPRLQHASRSLRRRGSPTPGSALQAALESVGNGHMIYRAPARKVDLSYVNIRRHDRAGMQRLLRQRLISALHAVEDARMSSIKIVARVILVNRRAALEGPEKLELTDEENNYLQLHGWTNRDVLLWIRILTEPRAVRAAELLFLHDRPKQVDDNHHSSEVPISIILTFLRRPHINAHALNDLLICIWTRLHKYKSVGDWCMSQSWFIMVLRLARHARMSWPQALVSVAAMFMQLFTYPCTRAPATHKKWYLRMQRLTYLSNKMLKFLALPSSQKPFISVPFHERAQFDMLGWMASHSPPLTINREGYLSIISVQLAHKKTDQERDWSRLKARSWPPWKQDRTGLDAEKGINYGTSRALQAIQRAAQAGYGAGFWEKSAQIISGWDTDMSPTVQTRAFLLHKYLSYPRLQAAPSWQRAHDVPKADDTLKLKLWASRIIATRTVQEAWACFLEYRDQKFGLSSVVYNAMLKKLLASEIRTPASEMSEDDDNLSLEPGDDKEVLPTPTSPKEATYVSTEAPDADAFANEMNFEGIRLGEDNLAMLISNAKTLKNGLKYASWATKRSRPKAEWNEFDDTLHGVLTSNVSGPMFCAIIRLLCTHPNKRLMPPRELYRSQAQDKNDSAFNLAVNLVKACADMRSQLKGLATVLQTLKDSKRSLLGVDKFPSGENRHALSPISLIIRYRFAENVLRACGMNSTSDRLTMAFGRTYLSLLERAIKGALDRNRQDDNSSTTTTDINEDSHKHLQIDQLLKTNLQQLQSFIPASADPFPMDTLIQQGSVLFQKPLPRLLSIPDPSTIHIIIRILGRLRNYQGILTLFEWMVHHKPEVRAAAQEPRNGRTMLKRCVVAARVFFEQAQEQAWAQALDDDTGNYMGKSDETTCLPLGSASSKEHNRLWQLVVQNEELFGEWPDDERMWRYLEKGSADWPVVSGEKK